MYHGYLHVAFWIIPPRDLIYHDTLVTVIH